MSDSDRPQRTAAPAEQWANGPSTWPSSDDPPRFAEAIAGWLAGATTATVSADTAGWGDAQWRAAGRAAEALGVGSLLPHVLTRRDVLAAIAPALRDILTERHERCRERGRRFAGEMRRVLALGALMDVPVVPLGDTAVTLLHGGDSIAHSDVDAHLLIRPTQETRLTSALARAGWSGIVRQVTPSISVYAERQCGDPLGDEPLRLQLHTSADFQAAGMRFDLTWAYWYEARAAFVLGVESLAPSSLRLLQCLLLQASERLMARELQLGALWNLRIVGLHLDAAAWSALTEEALNQHEARLFWAPLRLAERTFGPLAPAATLGPLQRQVPARLRDWVEAATPADWAARRFEPELPVDWAHWCRSPWELTLAARRMVLPLPRELRTPHVVRGYLGHVWDLARRGSRALGATAGAVRQRLPSPGRGPVGERPAASVTAAVRVVPPGPPGPSQRASTSAGTPTDRSARHRRHSHG